MSRLVKVAIIGRPNVGKSALFNAICKRRISIVDEAEGITRDRIYQETEFFGYPFELIDTGGIEVTSKADFCQEIKKQAHIAIQEADSIIMVVDNKAGIQELDIEIAKILHKTKKPLCLAVNKVDNFEEQNTIYTFSQLGIDKMIAVSAVHAFHVAELVEEALESFDKTLIPDLRQETLKIIIIGRPNVGKSLLLNSLINDERVIVSPIAGTTRDAIDTPLSWQGEDYLFIDTAGIRRTCKETESVEKFASIRSQEALKRADIALLIIDVMQGITSEEKKIARLIEEEGKGCIVLLNKWDLAQGMRMEHALKEIEQEFSFLAHCPKLCISAQTKRNIDKIFPLINDVRDAFVKRVSTGQLNRCLISAMQLCHPPVMQGKRLRIYYMAQIDSRPPRFVLFVNNPALLDPTYQKYLIHCLRRTFAFPGVPILMNVKGKQKEKRAKTPKTPPHIDKDLWALLENNKSD